MTLPWMVTVLPADTNTSSTPSALAEMTFSMMVSSLPSSRRPTFSPSPTFSVMKLCSMATLLRNSTFASSIP